MVLDKICIFKRSPEDDGYVLADSIAAITTESTATNTRNIETIKAKKTMEPNPVKTFNIVWSLVSGKT